MLDVKEQRLVKKYKEALQIPRWKYILIYGVIGWGLTVAILVTLVDVITDWKSLQQNWNQLLSAFLFFPLGGILMGLFMRWMARRQLNKLEKNQSTS